MPNSHFFVVAAASLTLLATGSIGGVANAGPGPVIQGQLSWTGNGTTVVDDRRVPTTTECAEEGPDYLLFQLTSTKGVLSPQIAFAGDAPQAMTLKNPGTSSGVYVSEYTSDGPLDVDALLSDGVVVTFAGNGRPTLTVARGCAREAEATVGVARFSDYTPVDGMVGIFCNGYPGDQTYAFFCAAALEILEPLYREATEDTPEGYEQGFVWRIGSVDPTDPPKLIPASFPDPTKFTSATFTDDEGKIETPVAPVDIFGALVEVYTLPGFDCDPNDYFSIVYDGVLYRYDVACPPYPLPPSDT